MEANHWDDLEDPAALDLATSKAKAKERFPCNVCSGTGLYQGHRRHQAKSHCFACRGKGYFETSQGDRMKAKAQRFQRKASNLSDAQDGFNDQNPGLIGDLRKLTDWNSFAGSLVQQFAERGGLSDKQVDSARRMLAKVANKQEARAVERAERQASAPTIDLTGIRRMFELAASQLKKPVYRAEGLILSLAPNHGKNPGAIYVKAGHDYQGKVIETSFHASYGAASTTLPSLLKIAADPLEAAVAYGRETGTCACCGRQLTDPKSVERGIGPVCAKTWGL